MNRVLLGWALWGVCVVLPAMMYLNSREQPLEVAYSSSAEPPVEEQHSLVQRSTTVKVAIEPVGAFLLLLTPPLLATFTWGLLRTDN